MHGFNVTNAADYTNRCFRTCLKILNVARARTVTPFVIHLQQLFALLLTHGVDEHNKLSPRRRLQREHRIAANHSGYEVFFINVTLLVVCVLGLPGNLLVIAVYLRLQTTSTRVYMFTLAVADLASCVSGVVMSAFAAYDILLVPVHGQYGKWIIGDAPGFHPDGASLRCAPTSRFQQRVGASEEGRSSPRCVSRRNHRRIRNSVPYMLTSF